jgi:hypothetical protein
LVRVDALADEYEDAAPTAALDQKHVFGSYQMIGRDVWHAAGVGQAPSVGGASAGASGVATTPGGSPSGFTPAPAAASDDASCNIASAPRRSSPAALPLLGVLVRAVARRMQRRAYAASDP